MTDKKLYKDKANQMLGGVCSGFAKFFGIDATWIRIGWVLFTFAGGCGVLAYIIAAILMPEEPVITQLDDDFSSAENQ